MTAESSTIRIRVRRPGCHRFRPPPGQACQLLGERLVVEGFHQVLVGAGIEGAQDEVVFGLGGDHHDLQIAEALGAHWLSISRPFMTGMFQSTSARSKAGPA